MVERLCSNGSVYSRCASILMDGPNGPEGYNQAREHQKRKLSSGWSHSLPLGFPRVLLLAWLVRKS